MLFEYELFPQFIPSLGSAHQNMLGLSPLACSAADEWDSPLTAPRPTRLLISAFAPRGVRFGDTMRVRPMMMIKGTTPQRAREECRRAVGIELSLASAQ